MKRWLVVGVSLLALSACVGYEKQMIPLPDGRQELVVTSFVKHPVGPNTQVSTVYICQADASKGCEYLRSTTNGGAGILDLVPAAAVDEAVGLSNTKAPVTNVTGTSSSSSSSGATAGAIGVGIGVGGNSHHHH